MTAVLTQLTQIDAQLNQVIDLSSLKGEYILSGSLITKIINNNDIGDIDIFIKEELPPEHKFFSSVDYEKDRDNFKSYYLHLKEPILGTYRINLINPKGNQSGLEIVSRFDLRHVNWYFEPKTNELFLPAETMRCVENKILSANNARQLFWNTRHMTKFRLRKYIERGFVLDDLISKHAIKNNWKFK